MRDRTAKMLAGALCVVDVYLLSFFFVFQPVKATWELVDLTSPRTGPQGVSLVRPVGGPAVRKGLYYLYYPVHAPLKAKGWIFPVYDLGDLMDGME